MPGPLSSSVATTRPRRASIGGCPNPSHGRHVSWDRNVGRQRRTSFRIIAVLVDQADL
jgi:hypothetical protein